MSSDYQIWMTHNGGTEKIRFPVLPEAIHISKGIASKSIPIAGLGEVVVKEDPLAIVISFESFFPSGLFPGVQFDNLTPPNDLKDKLTIWQKSKKPVHFVVTGTSVNLFFIIENFTYREEGGDIGILHYELVLKEYKEIKVRQIKVKDGKAAVPSKSENRTDNRIQPKTHTVVKGDTLWAIAKQYLGDGSKHQVIYNANKDKIKNPNLIYPGQVLKLP